jgi:hypothetical protein
MPTPDRSKISVKGISSKGIDTRRPVRNQLSRMNCQMFSSGSSSGHFGGSGTMVMLCGMTSLSERCQPAWSSNGTACRPRSDVGEIAALLSLPWACISNHGRWVGFSHDAVPVVAISRVKRPLIAVHCPLMAPFPFIDRR